MVWPSLLYGQVIKHHLRRKLVKVEQRVLCGEKADFVSRLKALGLTGVINTSFVERLNLTIREGVSKLARRVAPGAWLNSPQNWLSICFGGWRCIILSAITRS
jgi:hypothetical protein